MDSEGDRDMLAEAEAVGFCIPPCEKRRELFGRVVQKQKGFNGSSLNRNEIMNEPQDCLKHSNFNSITGWGRNVYRSTADFGGRRITCCEVVRGSGDATTGISNASFGCGKHAEEEKGEENTFSRDLSEESLHPDTRDSSTSVNNTSFGLPSVQSASTDPCCNGCPLHQICSKTQPTTLDVSSLVTQPLKDVHRRTPEEVPFSKPTTLTKSQLLLALVILIIGLAIFALAEMYCCKWCSRKQQLTRRLKTSLPRMITNAVLEALNDWWNDG